MSKGDPVCAQQRRLLERPSRRAFGAPQDEEVVSFRQTITRSKAPRAAAVGRMGNAEEVALTILFLASDESSFPPAENSWSTGG